MKNSKKVIGIPGWVKDDADFFGAGINHLEFISEFGNARIIMPWEEKVDIDLLYLPGGLDTAPSNYGEVPSYSTSNQDVMKEFFYKERLKNYIKDTPIFGVCLGMQMLGVYFGSKLHQNLKFHPDSPGRWETAHTIYNLEDDKDEFEVNSHHHQCILKSGLSKKLKALYKAECDEPLMDSDEYIVEAFMHRTLPIVAVQWHPEELYCDYSIKTMNNLLVPR